jgi:hypothetical protein
MSRAEVKMNTNAANQALWRIAETDDTRQVEAALASGAQIDAGNAYGTTALMRAASKGRTQMVRVLLEHGADPNRSRNDKFTPLLLAAFFGHEEIVKILAEHGAQTNAATRFGTSAQMWAASRTFKDVVQYLKNPESDPPAEQAKEARLTDWNQRAASTVIAGDKPKLRTTNITPEASVERARRLVGLPSTPNKVEAKSIPEVSQSQAVVAVHTPRPSSLVRLQASSKGVAVYAFTILLVVVALVGFTLQREQRLKEGSPQRIANTSVDKVSPSVTGSVTNSLPSGGEVPAVTAVDSRAADKVAVDSEANRTADKAPRLKPLLGPRALNSAGAPGNRYSQGKQANITNNDQLQPIPTPALVENGSTDLAVAPVTTKPKPIVSDAAPRAPTASPVKRSVGSSTELITGSKSSAPKGKVIQWP